MYGKSFASKYTGSMFGKPAIVFAVLDYAISLARPSRKDGECYVEINPALLAATFATSPDEVMKALDYLESPDPASRTKRDDGRRLVLVDGQERNVGPMQYRLVNGATYRAIRDEEERREQNRLAKRNERKRKLGDGAADIADSQAGQPRSAQVEEQVEGEVEVKGKSQHLAADEALEKPVAEIEKGSGVEALEIITRTLEVVAPNVRPDDFTVSQWLRDIHQNPWWIAAALCESDLTNAHHPKYVTALLRRRADEGWTAGDDPRAYVEYALSPKRRLHLASAQMGAA